LTSTSKLSPLIDGTRRIILEILLKTEANAVTLAEELNINISAIRGHLDVLEIAGLVSSSYEHATRGRPKRVYSLTPLVHSLFPNQTTQLFSALVQAISQSLDMKTTNSLIRQVVANIWHQILPDKPSGKLEDQLTKIVLALDNYGFYASLELVNDRFSILIHNDVFQPALSAIPVTLSSRFQQDFWSQLTRVVDGIQIRLVELPETVSYGYRVLIEERKEK
jgi:predicted ArsR family transcriptional regulator